MTTVASLRRAFSGKVALVTGAGSGIGRALAAQLTMAGATVYAIDRDAAAVGSLTQKAGACGKLYPVVFDVTDSAAYAKAVATIERDEDSIDFLFNNAGVTMLAEAHMLEFSRWKWLLDINVMGVATGIHQVYPRMIRQGGGHIVNTASIAGSTGYATAAAYTASKACILELTRSLRAEARTYGISVSVGCPGYVDSRIFTQERVVGAELHAVIDDLPVKMMSADKAAEVLLKGVSRGRQTIVFPLSARILWHMSHWIPSLLAPIQKRLMRPFRIATVQPPPQIPDRKDEQSTSYEKARRKRRRA